MIDTSVTDERMATIGTIDVRIRSDEYTTDESSFLCTVPLDKIQALVDMVCAWGVAVDGNTFAGTGSVYGKFVIGRYGTYFELVVETTK